MQGGKGRGGGGDDHDNESNSSSPNGNDNGAEEEEVTVDIFKDKGEDFAMGLMSIRWDDAATMMNVPPPLLLCCPLPLRGLLLQHDNRTVGAKDAVASATTAAKVGIVTRAMASSGAMTNAMDVVAWRQSHNNINNNNDNSNQCWWCYSACPPWTTTSRHGDCWWH
jgi:hypothetical protein